MAAVRAPAFWLSLAAAAISTVAVTAMVSSGGPRESLDFAGAVLLPVHPASTAPAVPAGPPRVLAGSSAPQLAPTPAATPAGSVSSGSAAPSDRPAATSSSAAAEPSPWRTTGSGAQRPAPVNLAGTPSVTSTVQASMTHRPLQALPAAPPGQLAGEPSEPVVSTGLDTAELARALFTALNQARSRLHLAPLRWLSQLQRSAHQHNVLMAAADQLKHRVGDEPALGVREAGQGLSGSYSAEVLGLARTATLAAGLELQAAMLTGSVAGQDRQILLSSTADSVGIDVLPEFRTGRLWLTEDFAKLA